MTNPIEIDMRQVLPRDRHPLIFKTFDRLASGDACLLINDHDPKPLFYQFQAERSGQFDWSPQEEGPDRWVIKISRTAQAGAVS